MTETRINPGESPYGAAYGLPPYPSPPYGDPLGLDPLAPPRRQADAWTPGATPAPDAWATRSDPAPGGLAAPQPASRDVAQSLPWAGSPEAPWGLSQSGQLQVGATGSGGPPGGLAYGNPISPPYGVAPYGGAEPAQPSGAYPYGYGDQQASRYSPGREQAYPSGQYPQYTTPAASPSPYGQPAGYPADYAASSGQYASSQYPAYPTTSYASSQYPTPPSGQYPASALSGQYPAPSGQYPATLSGEYSVAPYPAPAPAPSGQYQVGYAAAEQALSGQYPAGSSPAVYQGPSGVYPSTQLDQFTGQAAQLIAPSGQYPPAQSAVPAVAASGQYPIPAWASSPSGAQLALPAPHDLEGPTGQHERVRPGKKSRAAARIETARVAADEDAQFLSGLKAILKLPSMFPRMIFVALGFTAIGPLALAYVEVLPLPVSARLILLPATLCVIALGLRYREWGRRALIGWVAGIIATIIYDCLRLSLVKVGIWGDPIPGIGRLLLDDPNANWMWGYAWRLMGNGGGMAIAFTMLPWRGVKAGIIYGTMICLGLVAVLAFWPVAQEHFFPLTPITAAGGMAGHWVYGAVLGWITARFLPPVRVMRSDTAAWPAPEQDYRPAHAAA